MKKFILNMLIVLLYLSNSSCSNKIDQNIGPEGMTLEVFEEEIKNKRAFQKVDSTGKYTQEVGEFGSFTDNLTKTFTAAVPKTISDGTYETIVAKELEKVSSSSNQFIFKYIANTTPTVTTDLYIGISYVKDGISELKGSLYKTNLFIELAESNKVKILLHPET